MRRLMISLSVFCLVWGGASGCHQGPPVPSQGQIRAAQAKQGLGPTTGWRLAPADWAKKTAEMRDRAYAFCMEKHPNDPGCLADQDQSLVLANHADSVAAMWIKQPDDGHDYARALAANPDSLPAVRAYCFSIYHDAGARDARMLGPCMQNMIGGDYFGIVPVP